MRDLIPSEALFADKERRASHFRRVLNDSLNILFKDVLRISLRNPSQADFFYKTIRWQKRAARIRARWKQRGIHVPPIVIFRLTNSCDLHCKGCYAQVLRQPSDKELDDDKVRTIIEEARELGISFFVVAGGEPFMREEIWCA